MTTSPSTLASTAAPVVAVDDATVLRMVDDIAADLCATALWSDDLSHEDRCLWLGDEVLAEEEAHPVVHQVCGPSLYTGTAGIGWFLAHAAAVSGDAEAARTARGALRHALASVGADGVALGREFPGLHAGDAGVGLAVLSGGMALDDPDLTAAGTRTLQSAAERALDWPAEFCQAELISGDAGVVVALLRAADLVAGIDDSAAGRFHDLAERLGRRILAAAVRGETGWTWPQSDDEPALCSQGHGGSGPALACAELAAVTGDAAFAEAAAQAARSERAWFAPQAEGWPDLREFTGRDAQVARGSGEFGPATILRR